jgi:uncharacterized protein (TIGR02588 family)
MSKRKSEIPVWEWAIAALGACIVLGAIALFAVQIARPFGHPSFTISIDSVLESGTDYVVVIEVRNHGRTASNVTVEGTLTRGTAVERSETALAFLPAKSRQTAALLFNSDPRQHQLRVMVRSFTEP